MHASEADWSNFLLAAAGAAAALTGLLFVAVSLRPRAIRESPLMVGRARAAFYALVTVLLVSLVALVPRHPVLVGASELAVAFGVLALSSTFTRHAVRSGRLNYRRAVVYHLGLAMVVVAGFLRATSAAWSDTTTLLAGGLLLLMGIGVSNSWQLVLSHDSGEQVS
ncbi:MAG: hypothetical protein JOZ04_03995 [Acidimicrobiia bacterium]|nr:hypothetical protein [Acidimicrobiia bacterium]